MLTRLKVKGFKNLVDVDVRFGPLTVIAGENGTGKSNLLDAIRFLSALAEKPLNEAALSIRGEGGRNADIRGLFTRVGDDHVREMSFEAEMIVPHRLFSNHDDELEIPNTSSFAHIRYRLGLGWVADNHFDVYTERLKVLYESLDLLSTSSSRKALLLPMTEDWFERFNPGLSETKSLMKTYQTNVDKDQFKLLTMYQSRHAVRLMPNNTSLTTVMSQKSLEWLTDVNHLNDDPLPDYVNAVSPKQAFHSWRICDFIPSMIRRPSPLFELQRALVLDHFRLNELRDDEIFFIMGDDGTNLAAELYALTHREGDNGRKQARIRNQLVELIGVKDVWVDRDDRREELYLMLKDRNGVTHPARSLSDGTLRYIALATLMQRNTPELICIEEIENGVHPQRLSTMLRMLRDSVVDTNYPIYRDNPLRQVIVTTHSPALVQQAAPGELLFAQAVNHPMGDGNRVTGVEFRGVDGTWREGQYISIGRVLEYLNPVSPYDERYDGEPERLVDDPKMREFWFATANEEEEPDV